MMCPHEQCIPICPETACAHEGATKSFLLRDASSFLIEGFLVRHGGELRAYQNQCPHMPLSLDYGDGQFFDEGNRYILCRNHGALFDPATGLCLAGPCAGARLKPLGVHIYNGVIHVERPPGAPELEE